MHAHIAAVQCVSAIFGMQRENFYYTFFFFRQSFILKLLGIEKNTRRSVNKFA